MAQLSVEFYQSLLGEAGGNRVNAMYGINSNSSTGLDSYGRSIEASTKPHGNH